MRGLLDPKEMGYYLSLAQVGLEIVAPLGLGVALDLYYGWKPWGIIGGAILGFVGGLTHMILLANRQQGPGGSKPGEGDDKK